MTRERRFAIEPVAPEPGNAPAPAGSAFAAGALAASEAGETVGAARLRQVKAEHLAELKRLSLFDELTGLPNRSLLLDRLEQREMSAERDGQPFAVLMINLDLFKAVNHSFGHKAGDHVLRVVAERFRELARRTDTCARWGGDEFVILLARSPAVASAIVIAEKLAAAIAHPIAYADHMIRIDSSIGIALYRRGGRGSADLLRNAERAMKLAKRTSARFRVFDEHLDDAPDADALTAVELRRLIHDDELCLHYQPQYDLENGEIIRVEALARWAHPILGLLPPDRFIPTIDRSKYLLPFTDCVAEMAVAQIRRWSDGGLRLPVAINVSCRVVDDPSFPRRLERILEYHQVPAELLTIELTESSGFDHFEVAKHTIQRLVDLGVGVSIDDFGTGFTSLRYLREFAVNEIKIDRVFVAALERDGRDAAIVSAVLRLAEGFNATVIAEGIETEFVRAELMALGCRYGQGFLLGRPLPAAAVTEQGAAIAPPSP